MTDTEDISLNNRLSERIRIRTFSKQRCTIKIVLFLIGAVTVFTMFTFKFPRTGAHAAVSDFLHYAGKMFLSPAPSSRYSPSELLHALGVSLALAVLTTVIGVVFAFFLSLAAAQNLSNKILSNIVRNILSAVRAIPTIIWVLIFSHIASIGAEAAVLGMSFHSTAYLVKGFSEAFEQIDKKTIEALKACGAGYFEVILQAVLPASINHLISWSFFRFEINFGNAIAVGAAAGAGGIGYQLFMAGIVYFDIKEVGLVSYMIFAVSIILETVSSRIRNKMRLT